MELEILLATQSLAWETLYPKRDSVGLNFWLGTQDS